MNTQDYSDDELIVILQTGLCRCGNIGSPLHPCPFSEEIHNDNSPCNCCDNCQNECAMDI